jgi:hypothetical protein
MQQSNSSFFLVSQFRFVEAAGIKTRRVCETREHGAAVQLKKMKS